jgi:hypothetical protein
MYLCFLGVSLGGDRAVQDKEHVVREEHKEHNYVDVVEREERC